MADYGNYREEDWESKFKQWKEKNLRKEAQTQAKITDFVRKEENKVEQIVQKGMNEIIETVKEPKNIRVIKWLLILIPLIIIAYIIYANFFAFHQFNYFYDIGNGNENYLSPLNRVSSIVNETPNYRNLTSSLVYFSVPIATGSDKVLAEVKLKGEFPDEGAISLGAQDQAVWHYNWKNLYNPGIAALLTIKSSDNVYKTSESLQNLSLSELENSSGFVIASSNDIVNYANKQDYQNINTTINATLRGGHKFYVYLNDSLNLDVKKQDLNWYNGSDELDIALFDLNSKLIANTSIEDDGIIDNSKGNPPIQEKTFIVGNLTEGVYRIEFADFDGLIRGIKVNTNKIVAENKVFLADSNVYNKDLNKTSEVYTKLSRNSDISFLTYHSSGFQNVLVNNNLIAINNTQKEVRVNLGKGDYAIESPKNDIIISSPGYFAFSNESYFEPFSNRVIPLTVTNIQSADYIVLDQGNVIKDGDWIVSSVSFNLNESYVQNNKLSLVFNAPFLNQEGSNSTISIDWINVTVYKPGVFKK